MQNRVIHRGENSEVAVENGKVIKTLLKERPSRSVAYFNLLSATGLKVANTKELRTNAIEQEFVGEETLKDRLKADAPLGAFNAVIREVNRFTKGRKNKRVGISPKPSNFVFKGNEPYYVDLTPAYDEQNPGGFFHSHPLGIRAYLSFHAVAEKPQLFLRAVSWLIKGK